MEEELADSVTGIIDSPGPDIETDNNVTTRPGKGKRKSN